MLGADGKPLTWGVTTQVSVYTSLVGGEKADVQAAMDQWNANGGSPHLTMAATDPGQGAAGAIRVMEGVPTLGGVAQTDYEPTGDVITYATVRFDRNATQSDGNGGTIKSYTPIVRNGDAFLTQVIAHELGHCLGLDDFRDQNGKPIDSPKPSAMGASTGNNNQGIPATPGNPGQPPGNGQGVTPCDKDAVAQNEATLPSPSVGSGEDGGGGGGGGGGGCGTGYTSYGYTEWDDDSNSLTYLDVELAVSIC